MLTRRTFLATSAAVGAGLTACRGPIPKDLATYDATAQAELVAKRRATPLELVDAAIARIQKLNPQLNFLAADAFESARARAKAGKLEGPFAGVPYLLKDLIEYPGVSFRSGSRMMASVVGKERPPLVAVQEAAGLIMVGKSTTPEFGLTASTEPVLTGPTHNPWELGHTPGGSSGGAAAAVASGAVPIAHANDGAGSIRIPASCCGVFGLKPSRGRVVSAGDELPGLSLIVNHCISRSVRDSARLLSVTERIEPGAPLPPVGFIAGPDKRKLKIGVSTKRLDGKDAAPAAHAAVKTAIDACRSLGHEIVERDYPLDGQRFIDAFLVLWSGAAFQAAASYKKLSGTWPDTNVLEPWTLGLAAYFQMQPVDALSQATAALAAVGEQVDQFLGDVDVMLTPVVDGVAPDIGYLDPKLPFVNHLAHILTFVAYTPIHNIAGTPAMSVPLYWTPEGLPIGTQFAARRGGEATLLSLAYELEKAKPWAKRRPPVFAIS